MGTAIIRKYSLKSIKLVAREGLISTIKQASRYLGLDLSTNPGIAIIDVKNEIPLLISTQSIRTTNDKGDAQRYAYIESFITRIAYEFGPFDKVVRESFTSGRNRRATQTVFGSWAATDSGLNRLNIHVTDEITPTSVKKGVTGNGNAKKPEVADGVRRILRLGSDFKFATDDESDACAVILAWLIREKLIGEVAA